MYEKILIPVDISSPEKTAHSLKAARHVGGKNAKFHVVAVIEDLPAFVTAELPQGVLEQSQKKIVEMLKSQAADMGDNVEAEVRHGTIYRAILAAAKDWGADIIVIGSHKPGAQDFLLGSTAAKVVRHATCPVLVVR